METVTRVDDPAMVAADCEVSPSAELRAPCVVGPHSRIGSDALIERSVLLEGCVVEDGARVVSSILSGGVTVEPGAELEGAVIGEDERVAAEVGAAE